jgi:hypothetical protein
MHYHSNVRRGLISKHPHDTPVLPFLSVVREGPSKNIIASPPLFLRAVLKPAENKYIEKEQKEKEKEKEK